MDFNTLKLKLEEEYSRLCSRLGLNPVELLVYEVDETSNKEIFPGIPENNMVPVSNPTVVALPQLTTNFEEAESYPLEFPPENWNKYDPHVWPIYRIELYHEVCHLIESQILEVWQGGNDNPVNFAAACRIMASSLNAEASEVLNVLRA